MGSRQDAHTRVRCLFLAEWQALRVSSQDAALGHVFRDS